MHAIWISTAIAVLGNVPTAVAAPASDPHLSVPEHRGFRPRLLEFDVAENGLEFVFDEQPVFDDGAPAYGNSFVTHGYIYPAGFLRGRDGVDDEGHPTKPRKVIGEWYCRGYLIGSGARTRSGPFVHSTQTYSFYRNPGYRPNKDLGERILVSTGYELVDVGRRGYRAITGGTRDFVGATGEAEQTLLGFDELEGVRLSFRLAVYGKDQWTPRPPTLED